MDRISTKERAKIMLNDPIFWEEKDKSGNTTAHSFAQIGVLELLKHPLVSKVKNIFKRTPLHYLARTGQDEVLKHPAIKKVKDIFGKTPYDLYKKAEKKSNYDKILMNDIYGTLFEAVKGAFD